MELLLALAVITAVIIFGALISLGNERQRRAIDELREQVVLWAIQDLRIKREHLAREVRVDDPLGWLNQIAAKAHGYDLKLQVVEIIEEPTALICSMRDEKGRVVFTPHSPEAIQHLQKKKQSRLSKPVSKSPLYLLDQKAKVYEISALNGSVMFDLELPLAWNNLTNRKVDPMNRVWMYIIY